MHPQPVHPVRRLLRAPRAGSFAKPLVAALLLGLVPSLDAQENYAQWTGHSRIWLNTQGNGAGVAQDVTGFPVLVRLTTAQATVFAQARANGADIRFTRTETTGRLPHQIERWDTAAKAAEIWVRVDTVRGNNGDQSIWMHWGKADAADSSSGPQVFRTTDGFQAVYHLNQPAAALALDATPNALHATPTSVTEAPGVIGPAKGFDGAASFYEVIGSELGALDFAPGGSYTVSAWVNVTTANSGTHYEIVSKHDRQYALKIHNSGNFEFFEFNPTTFWNGVRSPVETGNWKLLTGVAQGGQLRLYVDGALASADIVQAGTSGASGAGLTNLSIGKRGDNSTRFFNGLIDEVTLAGTARPDAWIRLAYQNQRAAQTLVSFSQPAPVRGQAREAAARLRAAPHGEGLLFRLPEGAAAGARLSVSDAAGRTVWSRTVAPGVTQVAWDGRLENGGAAPRGTYIARLQTPGHGASAAAAARVALAP